jgi:hypothetical protein
LNKANAAMEEWACGPAQQRKLLLKYWINEWKWIDSVDWPFNWIQRIQISGQLVIGCVPNQPHSFLLHWFILLFFIFINSINIINSSLLAAQPTWVACVCCCCCLSSINSNPTKERGLGSLSFVDGMERVSPSGDWARRSKDKSKLKFLWFCLDLWSYGWPLAHNWIDFINISSILVPLAAYFPFQPKRSKLHSHFVCLLLWALIP